jgi:hypothetical protein
MTVDFIKENSDSWLYEAPADESDSTSYVVAYGILQIHVYFQSIPVCLIG